MSLFMGMVRKVFMLKLLLKGLIACVHDTSIIITELHVLTHLPLAQMEAKLQTVSAIASMKIYLLQFLMKSVPWGVIEAKSSLVGVIAWHLAGEKPLSKPTMTQFSDANMWH